MADKSFVLVNLKEDKTKKLTQTLTNETCRKILDYLSAKSEATESQIAKDLKIPMSTVHYNLKQLAESKLVSVDEFHYSEKGKEIIHYKIANKYIIIAPDEDEGFLEKLKSVLPAFISISVATIAIYFTQAFNKGATLLRMEGVSDMATNTFSRQATPIAAKTAVASADAIAESSANLSTQTMPPSAAPLAYSEPNVALWFFIGGMTAMIIFLLWEFIKQKRAKRK